MESRRPSVFVAVGILNPESVVRLWAEASNLSESIILGIGNGLGGSNDRFGLNNEENEIVG